MASAATPTIELNMEADMVHITSKVAFFNQVINIKVGGEIDQEFQGLKMKCKSRWDEGKLITEAVPCEASRGKPQTFQRQVIDGELVQIGSIITYIWGTADKYPLYKLMTDS